MTFNFRFFAKVFVTVLFRSKAPNAWIWLRRVVVLLASYALFIVVETDNWVGFFLDNILFPNHRTQPIDKPIFIIGNPRSGTTFLQRLLARDTANFSCLKMWEIFFAPSITQRKIVWALDAADRWVGAPIKHIVDRIEARIRASTKLHRVGLHAPEEDEYLLLHTASTIIAGLLFAVPELAAPYIFFDRDIPLEEQTRVMAFYAGCIRRHLYAHKAQVHFLSKNPYFTPKVAALRTAFPDAHFIVLTRNPLNAIPSYASLSQYVSHILYTRNILSDHNYIITATQHWYRYPAACLSGAPDSFIEVKFEDMVHDPRATVKAIYQHLGFEISPAFDTILQQETERARTYKSEHEYSLEKMGFTREEILTTYSDIFEKWGFEKEE
ncbi:MAG: sulfotransferase [Anaerolineae bacterium]|nr:sulfotransferase [Anaerolineae bacterium]